MDLRKAIADCGFRIADSTGGPEIPQSAFHNPQLIFSPFASSAITFTVPSSLASLPRTHVHDRQRFRWKPHPHLPQEFATGEPVAVASPHPHEMLDRGAFELGRRPAHEVADTRVRPAPLALDHDRRRRLLAPVSNESEPHSHCI